MDNILSLHRDLRNRTYRNGTYKHFKIADPKPRDIHEASVRDRLLHHAVYRVLYPLFDKKFIHDSYSCRIGKGTHKALYRFADFAKSASFSNTKTVWVLKCDIRKFFAHIDHEILFSILERYIPDVDILNLLRNIIGSFSSDGHLPDYESADIASGNELLEDAHQRGLPLGNLTSQLLVNIYMNEFDQFLKHRLKVKYYIRYVDDFVLLSQNRAELEEWLIQLQEFLHERLKLSLHPDKVFIKTLASGVDFLGWIHFPDHRVLRTATKRRMFKSLAGNPKEVAVASYLGLLSHGNAFALQKRVEAGYSSIYESFNA